MSTPVATSKTPPEDKNTAALHGEKHILYVSRRVAKFDQEMGQVRLASCSQDRWEIGDVVVHLRCGCGWWYAGLRVRSLLWLLLKMGLELKREWEGRVLYPYPTSSSSARLKPSTLIWVLVTLPLKFLEQIKRRDSSKNTGLFCEGLFCPVFFPASLESDDREGSEKFLHTWQFNFYFISFWGKRI